MTLVVQAGPPLFLETLSRALTARGHLVRGATLEAAAAPALVVALGPDLCLLHDADPAGFLLAAQALRQQAPAVRVLVISTGASPQARRAYDERLVDALVVEACAFEILGSALERVADGERYLADGPPIVAAESLPALRLTPRERQVLEHLVRGASTQVIADELAISPHTVRSHVQGLTRKLGARSRGRAVTTALSRNLLDSQVS